MPAGLSPHVRTVVIFQFQLVRHCSQFAPPEIVEALGTLADCWLVNAIEPSYGEWEVKDPNHAGRCPDTFKMPKR